VGATPPSARYLLALSRTRVFLGDRDSMHTVTDVQTPKPAARTPPSDTEG